jgi:hypothetical protein
MIYGWDVSTSIVGGSVFDDGGKYQNSFHIDLRKIDGLNEKADALADHLDAMDHQGRLDTLSGQTHFLEERLGGFAAGRTSAQVLMKLGAFNALASYLIHSHDGRVLYIHPSTWKSLLKRDGLFIPKGGDKKALTLSFVQSREPGFPKDLNRNDKPQPWMYDMADAYCIGRAGYLKWIAGGNSQP